MNRQYKYRLYPSRKQIEALDFQLWQHRDLYNDALAECKWKWDRSRLGVSYYDQSARLTRLRHDHPDTIGKTNHNAMGQTLRRLHKAYSATFNRLKKGQKAGFPRFKSRARFNSIDYRYGNGIKLLTEPTGRKMLRIQHVGEVKIKYHRAVPDDAKIQRVNIKRSNGKWYATLTLEIPAEKVPYRRGGAAGIDIGLSNLIALDDGTLYEPPRWLEAALRDLRVAQRRVSRRKKGSKRRRKAADQAAKIHEHVANQRLDYWHKVTRQLVDKYALIAIEDMGVKFMANGTRSKSAQDAGLGNFRKFLEYKAVEAGTQVIAVNPYNTSKMCSRCHEIVPKTLRVRVHRCRCGLVLDRDVNAARNILRLGRSRQELTQPARVYVF